MSKVRLSSEGTLQYRNVLRPSANDVVFNITPKITESRVTQYKEGPLRQAGGITMYNVTENRKFNISATFVSRTVEEANITYQQINTLKSWLVPADTGGITRKPEVVKLWGYKRQFDGIPMSLSNLNITWGDDVDYIETSFAWVPIIQTVSMTLIETHTTDEIKKFDINLYKQGIMPGF